MLEEEAKSKWCPFGRTHAERDPQTATVNRRLDGDPDDACLCLGSGCMAWRVTSEVTGRGFCGLAGRPLA